MKMSFVEISLMWIGWFVVGGFLAVLGTLLFQIALDGVFHYLNKVKVMLEVLAYLHSDWKRWDDFRKNNPNAWLQYYKKVGVSQ